MAAPLKSLPHDPEHYLKAWKHSKPLAAELAFESVWGRGVFHEEVVANLRVQLDERKNLRVLGVGSGSGEIDSMMLTKLLKLYPAINNRVVEPSQDQLVMYRALVQDKALQLQGVECDWRQQTIDEYQKAGNGTKFHFVSAIHSIYYMKNADRSLTYMYDRLEVGGILLVVAVSDVGGYCRLWNRFPFFQDHRVSLLSSAEVRRCFERHRIPYTQHRQASCMDITDCFDESSEDGRMVVDFLTHVLKFKETAPAELQREVMEYLASSDCSEKTSDGRVLFNNYWDAVVVQKKS